jgi:hypothetical protein
MSHYHAVQPHKAPSCTSCRYERSGCLRLIGLAYRAHRSTREHLQTDLSRPCKGKTTSKKAEELGGGRQSLRHDSGPFNRPDSSGERPKSIIHTFSAIIEQHRRLSLMRYFIFVSTRIIICNAFSLRRQTSAIHDLERLELSRCDCKIPLVKCSLVFVSRSPITGKLNSLLLHVRLGKERSLPEPRTQQARRTFVPNTLLPQPCSASFRCQIELNVPHPRGFHFACILSITTAVISNRDTHLETYNVRQSPGTLQHSV